MKQYLDERQNQVLGKYATVSFIAMYLVCAVVIVAQLLFADGEADTVLGETAVMVTGGVIYLCGAVKNGSFLQNSMYGGKNRTAVNAVLSLLISVIFSGLFGLVISGKAGDTEVRIGAYMALFFLFITVLCFLTLSLLQALTRKSQKAGEEKYEA